MRENLRFLGRILQINLHIHKYDKKKQTGKGDMSHDKELVHLRATFRYILFCRILKSRLAS
jgi:hypothetical protein